MPSYNVFFQQKQNITVSRLLEITVALSLRLVVIVSMTMIVAMTVTILVRLALGRFLFGLFLLRRGAVRMKRQVGITILLTGRSVAISLGILLRIVHLDRSVGNFETLADGMSLAQSLSGICSTHVHGKGSGVRGQRPDVQVVHIVYTRNRLQTGLHSLPIHLKHQKQPIH